MCVCVRVCVYACVRVCVCAYVYVYVHMRAGTLCERQGVQRLFPVSGRKHVKDAATCTQTRVTDNRCVRNSTASITLPTSFTQLERGNYDLFPPPCLSLPSSSYFGMHSGSRQGA